MGTRTRLLVAVAILTVVIASATELVLHGIYGWTIFITVPVCAGGIACWAFRPPTAGAAVWIGVFTGCVSSCFFLVTGIEGIICVVMALIPAILLCLIGSVIVYCCFGFENPRTATMALLLPMSLWFDTHAEPPVYAVHTSLVVNASPEQVWKY